MQREHFQILISVLSDKYLFYPRSHSKPMRHLPEETHCTLPPCHLWVAAPGRRLRGRQPPHPPPLCWSSHSRCLWRNQMKYQSPGPMTQNCPQLCLQSSEEPAPPGTTGPHLPAAQESQGEREWTRLRCWQQGHDPPSAWKGCKGQLLALRISLGAFRGFPVIAYGEWCQIPDLWRRRLSFGTRLDHSRAFV